MVELVELIVIIGPNFKYQQQKKPSIYQRTIHRRHRVSMSTPKITVTTKTSDFFEKPFHFDTIGYYHIKSHKWIGYKIFLFLEQCS